MQPEQPVTPVNPTDQSPQQADPVAASETLSKYMPEGYSEPSPELPQAEPIRWQAPEYIQERRSPWWFIGFWVIVIILVVLAAFVMRSPTFAILVPVMAIALMIYSHRPPHMITYALSAKGLYINEKLHPLGEFRSFGVIQDESIPGLTLIPVKRFRPSLTVHFPVESGEAIVDMLGSRLPMQDVKLDMFDRLIKTLHI